MNRIFVVLLFILPLFTAGQKRIVGSGSDRGKFIINDGGKFIVAAEVEDESTHKFKFLVFSSVSGNSISSYLFKGNMPYAINDFIKNNRGNYVALGERYLEGNRESLLLIEMSPALTPVRAKASYENGNEVEPYDIIEYGNDYFITGFTKTSQLLSTGTAYITREKQRMYLTRYDPEFNQVESYIVGGFDDEVNPVGKQMLLNGNNLVVAGNIVGANKSEMVVINVDLITHKITWSTKIGLPQSVGVTGILLHDNTILVQCTTSENDSSDHIVVVMNTNGSVQRSWNMGDEGIQRSHCIMANKPGEVMLFGTSGKNRFESKRAAYLFSPETGKYRVNLQGDGIQSEMGRAAKTPSGFESVGYEFSKGKNGIDIVLRSYQESTFTSPYASAKEVVVSAQPISLSLDDYPITSGIFKSELFFEDVKYEPYYIWHVE